MRRKKMINTPDIAPAPLEDAHLHKEQQHGIRYINVSDIFASPTNPRKHFDERSLTELGESIRKYDVIQPVTLRLKKGMSGKYELVCGECRWLACKAIRKLTMPAIIRDLSDDEVLDLQFTENLHRQDVHPMDEAVTFQAMIATKRYTIADIAVKVLKSESFVVQRLSLNSLLPEFQKDFWEGKFLIGHAILFSRLTTNDQKELYKRFGGRHGYDTLHETKDYIDCHINRKLSSAPFKKDDADLLPKAGACSTCLKRSGCNTSLFPEYEKDDRCFDQSCFEQKMSAFVIQKVKSTIETKPEIRLVESSHYGEKLAPAIRKIATDMKVDILDCRSNDISDYQSSGTIPVKVLMVSGSDVGKVKTMYVRGKSKAAPKGDAAPKRTAASIDEEIKAIQGRQERALELDAEKVWEKVYKLLEKPASLTKAPFSSPKLTQDERNAMAIAIIDAIEEDDYTEAAFEAIGLDDISHIWALEKEHLEKLAITDCHLFHLLRLLMVSNLKEGTSPLQSNLPFLLMKVLRQPDYLQESVAALEAEQNVEASRRITNAEKRIATLQKEKTLLAPSKEKKNTGKVSSKKEAKPGKLSGAIKSLLDEPEEDPEDDE